MIVVSTLALAGRDAGEFQLRNSDSAKGAHGATKSKIVSTKTEAAMKFFVLDKENGPIKGVVICLTSAAAAKFCTDETDAEGYGEVLVPVGQKYDVTYLSLGGGDVAGHRDGFDTVALGDAPCLFVEAVGLTRR